MRTTVTLDADVQALLRKLMKERGLSFKAALNEAIRVGASASRHSAPREPFRQKTYRMGFNAELRWDKVLAMADAIEDEELTRKLSLRK